MKKSLLALAALTAFAGVASAQSSVTIFGVVDLAATGTDNGQDSKYLLAQDGNASTRLGFRGVEDLGGGLKAGFWLETALTPDSQNAPTFGRRSTVSLMSNWGELRLGRDYTPQFWNWTVFDPFGTNGVGAATNLALEVATIAGGNYATLVRADNTIGYFLPAMGGFYGQFMVAAGEGNVGNKMYGGRLGWAAGPFNVAGAWSTTQATLAQDITNWNIAGSWKLGGFMLSGFYSNIQADNSALFDQTNWYIGGSYPMGAMTFKASWGQVTRDAGPNKGDADQFAIGMTYDLSKRTALYATYSMISNDGTVFRTFGGTNALAGRNDDNTGYQFGIRHSF